MLDLTEALQVGPWRITRRILLFCIAFSVVVITFGILVLESHVFESEWEGDDDDDDDDDDRKPSFGNGFSSGDWVMVTVMVLAGIAGVAAGFACLLAKPNAPHHLTTSRQSSVYSIQLRDKNTKLYSMQTSYGTPIPINIYTQQPHTVRSDVGFQPQPATSRPSPQPQLVNPQAVPAMSGIPGRATVGCSNPSAPPRDEESPPPYVP